jgi:8-oxo-dGTP pyrophosphatase MutT (NUDIX family)
MYKIYINETPLILTNTEGVLPEWKNDSNSLVTKYLGRVKFLHNYIDTLEKSKKYNRIVVYTDDVKQLWKDFKGLYKKIDAAGGLVYNANNEVLVIYRRDFWDLPKGKIDKGETPEVAAIREVQEETGLEKIDLIKHIKNTYHTYIHNEKRILKKTYWYAMKTNELALTPQYSEDIEKAEWVNLAIFLANHPTIYGSILEVLHTKEN